MSKRLIYRVKKLYMDGREIPLHRVNMTQGIRALFRAGEGRINGANGQARTTMLAALYDPNSGKMLPEFPQLYDVVLRQQRNDEITVAGIERGGTLDDLNYRQAWRCVIEELEEVPEYLGTLDLGSAPK